ncbi:MAG TPA: heme-binding domain-containing protein [Candidatus Binataceae bacterium]|nr:heme-binding domain-containing protein [Candidatus Binataceae bacterium]
MRKPALATLIAFGVAVLAAQLITVERVNPPTSLGSPLAPPAQIEALLTRACYDCHSNQTRWPWYSHIAPVSWLVARDVALGRKELNFSEWGSYYPQTRRRKLQWIGRVLREGSMPPWAYRLMHPRARLTGAERATLERWVESSLSTPAPRATTD